MEAYIGGSTTKETRAMAEEAVRLIHQYLKTAYDDGQNKACLLYTSKRRGDCGRGRGTGRACFRQRSLCQPGLPVSYTHLDVYKRQEIWSEQKWNENNNYEEIDMDEIAGQLTELGLDI